MSSDGQLLELLRRTGVVTGSSPRLTPLSGGVSSEIYLVEDVGRKFVCKRALAKLRVREDWFADVSRNRAEQSYLRYVGSFLPAAVPRMLEGHPEHGFFTMEFVGDGFTNWKQLLLAGEVHAAYARRAGQTLGEIHRRSFGQQALAADFNPMETFRQLRLDPYLGRAAERHPDLAPQLRGEADRLAATRDCLVHGDYSPKNLLVSHDRLVILDCEVACFSDAAFDLAFLINHFFLKTLHHHPAAFEGAQLVAACWRAYTDARGSEANDALEARTVRLLPMLMLARVDGTSPAEYLTQKAKQNFIREVVRPAMREPGKSLERFTRRWQEALAQHPAALT